MAATIKIKNSSTAGAAPTSSDLVQGELAVNVTDKRLYTENSGGTIVELGTNPSVPVTFPDGSASAPSLTNSGDTNTGMFFPAADTIAFAEGGTESMRLDSSGNLGLGVTPSAWSAQKAVELPNGVALASYTAGVNIGQMFTNAYYNGTNYIYKNSDYAEQYAQRQGAHIWYNSASGTAGNAISFTQAMTLDASGNLGLGSTSPNIGGLTRALTLNTPTGGNYSGVELAGAGTLSARFITNNAAGTFIGSQVSIPLVFETNATERARIDSSGNLLVGTTNTSLTAGVGFKFIPGGGTNPYMGIVTDQSTNGNANYHLYSTGAGAYRFYVGNGGTINATSTTITGISDQRLKENIRDLDDGLNKVMALKPRKFDWKEGKGKGIVNDRGFIAQEFETVFPDMIEEWLDPAPEGEEPYKAVNANLIPTLVKAIQELNAKFEAYKAAHP